MGTIDPAVRTFRVIAEGDDAVGTGLTIGEAVAVLEFTRERRGRYVSIVDDLTGTLVDEGDARAAVERE
jgi:hypothetical protein